MSWICFALSSGGSRILKPGVLNSPVPQCCCRCKVEKITETICSSLQEPLEPAAIYNAPPPGTKVGLPPEPVTAEEVSFGQVASQFLEHTSAHGLPRIIISKGYFRKILWALIFLGALAYFIYQVQNNFNTFFEYPVGVNIKIRRRWSNYIILIKCGYICKQFDTLKCPFLVLSPTSLRWPFAIWICWKLHCCTSQISTAHLFI